MKIIFSLLFLFAISWNTQADNSQYSIQLLASESPDLTNFGSLVEFGAPYIENTGIGLVRVKVGSFNSRVDAKDALKKIRNKGFKDAFISSYTNRTTRFTKKKIIPATLVKKAAAETKLVDPETTSTWSKLSAEQKSNVVYLDGVLHLLVNEGFVPLTSY